MEPEKEGNKNSLRSLSNTRNDEKMSYLNCSGVINNYENYELSILFGSAKLPRITPGNVDRTDVLPLYLFITNTLKHCLINHTHPSHSPTSRLLTSSSALGVPVPRSTQCIRGV
jgi:hypothetical protein